MLTGHHDSLLLLLLSIVGGLRSSMQKQQNMPALRSLRVLKLRIPHFGGGPTTRLSGVGAPTKRQMRGKQARFMPGKRSMRAARWWL